MRRYLGVLVCIFCGGLLVAPSAQADEVRLKNGDRLTGKVLRMQGDKLLLQTEYAGELSIAWAEVGSLATDAAIRLVLSDGTVLQGRTIMPEEGRMTLETEKLAAPSSFALTDVKAINPEEAPPVKVTARVNMGLTSERGNSDTDSLRLQGSFVARTAKSRYGFGGELNREDADGIDTVRNWLAYGNYDYFFAPKWYGYVLTLFENDRFADLDLRSTLGAGVGYQFFETDTLNLSAAVGPAYVDENFMLAEDRNFAAGQWLINYEQYFFNKFMALFHNQNGYFSLDDSSDWVIKTRQGLRFPIYGGFTATFQYNYDYNHNPSPDAKSDYDSKVMVLLGYEFNN